MMFEAIGRFSYRFRWLVIALWIVLFGVSVAATPWLADVLKGGFSNPGAPGQRAAAVIEGTFEQGPTNLLILFSSDTLQATSPEFQAAEKQALAGLTAAQIPSLESIQTYATTGSPQLISRDGRSSVAVLNFSASQAEIQKEVDKIRELLRDTQLQAYVTGEPAVNADLTQYSFSDLRKVELYALPVALIALLFVFGSLVSAALPVITGGLAVTVTLGGMWLIWQVTSLSIFAMNVATLLGLAVAIDYALLMVSRFREESHKGATVKEAVIVTSARAGRSVFFSGAAVMVGVVGLTFFPSPGLRSMGIAGALVVFFSVMATISFVPALLGVLGRRVDSLPVIRLHAAREARTWKRWAGLVLKRPWVTIAVSVAIIALLAGPAATLRTQMTSAQTLPPAAESRQGLEILDRDFDREALSPTSVLLTWEGEPGIDMFRAGTLFFYGQQLSGLPGVASVLSPFTLPGVDDPTALAALWPQFEKLLNDPDGFVVPAGGVTLDGGVTISAQQLEQFKQLVKASVAPGAVLFRVVSQEPVASEATQALVGDLLTATPPAGYTAYVAGEAVYNYDFFKELNTWFPWVIVWVVFTSLAVFVVLLRSIVLPVLAVVVNLLTIAMAYGLLVLLFQGDALEKILHFTATGAVDAVIPVVMLCVLFGITMDYAVFMLTRMHERWRRTHDNRESVTTGLVRTGRVIVSAALLVAIVTGAFVFTSIGETKMLGLGIALAIIVDTILIRLTLLPALMIYLGGANWWWPGASGFQFKKRIDLLRGFGRRRGSRRAPGAGKVGRVPRPTGTLPRPGTGGAA
jgi:RND superfamily putative drug exporter